MTMTKSAILDKTRRLGQKTDKRESDSSRRKNNGQSTVLYLGRQMTSKSNGIRAQKERALPDLQKLLFHCYCFLQGI